MPIRLMLTEADIARCYPVLRELRPKLTGAADLVARALPMLAEGAQIAAHVSQDAGEGEDQGAITTVACFRIHTMLVSGVTMYVDDLVTAERFRSRGHGKAMLAWLMRYAKDHGCETFSLDSGTFRPEAHAFYFREGLRITSFHFESAV